MGADIELHRHQPPVAARPPSKSVLSYAKSSLHEIFGHEAEGGSVIRQLE